MPVACCELGEQTGDARRAEQNVFPDVVDVLAGDIGIVALDVHLDDGCSPEMFLSVFSNATLAHAAEEKMWKRDWQEKPVQDLRMNLLQLIEGVVNVSELCRFLNSSMWLGLLSLLEWGVVFARVLSESPQHSAFDPEQKF